MAGSKHFEKVAWTFTLVMLLVTALFMNGAALGVEAVGRTMGYETRLFDNTQVHSLSIVMDNWDEFIATAESETYYAANIVIDGEAYKNVGIRAKGNTSLSTVATLGSERYSFKIEFDQYDSSKSYYGLDKLSLNNLIQDSTMMKDYLTYTMMREFGADTPLCSFVYITVNGEDWGLYLAVEGVEEAFLARNYGAVSGELYKPDSLSFGGGRGNGAGFDMNAFSFDDFSKADREDGLPQQPDEPNRDAFPSDADGAPPDLPQNGTEGGVDVPAMPDGAFPFDGGAESGGFGMGSADVKLQYIDDDLDSYSNIWDNAKTDITEADQKRLIASLKKLSAGEEIDSVVNVEQVLRYFVVHNYVCNGDSYTGSMIHNYYLYEENGQLTMIPWDYNLAFGTFGGGSASSEVNTPIDSPVTGGSSDRPMLNWIFADETYTALYHQYFSDFLNTVDIQALIDDAFARIAPYVQKDPTAFYTYAEFELGVETLRQFCSLRSESISAQLESGETVEQRNYADASSINLSDMGSMNMGGGQGGSPGGMGALPEDFDFSAPPDGFVPGDEMSDGFSGQDSGAQPENAVPEQPDGTDSAESHEPSSRGELPRPDGMNGDGRGAPNDSGSQQNAWIWLAVSFGVLVVGLLIAKLYRA